MPNRQPTPNSRTRPHPSREVERLGALLAGLTRAEYVVLLWLCEGKRNGEIAKILGRSRRTVESHVSSIFEKLEAETRGVAVRALIDFHIATGTPIPWPDDASTHRHNGRSKKV